MCAPTRWNELHTGCVSVVGPSRGRRSVLRRVARAVDNGVQYTIGANTTCDQYPETVFCNGQLPEGTNFMYGGFPLMHVPNVCVCVCVCVPRACVCSGISSACVLVCMSSECVCVCVRVCVLVSLMYGPSAYMEVCVCEGGGGGRMQWFG